MPFNLTDQLHLSLPLPFNSESANLTLAGSTVTIEEVDDYLLRIPVEDRYLGMEIWIFHPFGDYAISDFIEHMRLGNLHSAKYKFVTTDDDGLALVFDSVVIINNLITGGETDALSAEQGKYLKGLLDSHGSSHISSGTDPIEGDKILINYIPTNYVRDNTPAEADELTELTSHLFGIDALLSNFHEHTNKDILDAMTTNKATEWDAAYIHSIQPHAPNNADNTALNETSHVGIVVHDSFPTSGLLKRTAPGTYTAVPDNSGQWDTAFSWGDHDNLYEPLDVTLLRTTDVDDTPEQNAFIAPISSNWAFIHESDTDIHYVQGDIQIEINQVTGLGDLVEGTGVSDIFVESHPQFPIEYLKITKEAVTTTITEIAKPNGIIYGGQVTWLSGFSFAVGATAYYIDGILYESSTSEVTLGTSDPTNPRFDVIAVNEFNNVVTLQGVPSENPQKPTVNPLTQIELTYILVPAASTEPNTITNEILYDENTEWVGSTEVVYVNFATPTDPYKGSLCAESGVINTGDAIIFTNSSTINISDFDNFIMAIRLKIAMNRKSSIILTLYSGVNAISEPVTLNINRDIVDLWQMITVPVSNFVVTSGDIDKIKLEWYNKTTQPDHTGIALDLIKFEQGISVPVVSGVVSLIGDVLGTGDLGTDITTTLANVVTGDVYGGINTTLSLTVDNKGRITDAIEHPSEELILTPDQIQEDYVTVLYGGLYNWWAVNDVRNIGNDGWIPLSDVQVNAIIATAGGDDQGQKLREIGTTYWFLDDFGSTNELGYNARGSGNRDDGNGAFISFQITHRIWQSNAPSESSGGIFGVNAANNDIIAYFNPGGSSNGKEAGYPCRLYNPNTILSDGEIGEYIGNNGIIYPTICIGAIEVIAADLIETKYNNGDWISGYDNGIFTPITNLAWSELTTEYMCFYDNDEGIGSESGTYTGVVYTQEEKDKLADDVLVDTDIGETVASQSHTHTLSQVTDAGSIASKDFWSGTQAEYDALGSWDSNTLYFITE